MIILSKITEKDRYIRLGKSLRYALYCIFHPFDGFWCLTREKKGSFAAANVIVFLMIVAEILRLTTTTFQFITVYADYFNILYSIGTILVPLLLWTVSNWGFTTLMEGKGRLKEIYIATAYSFTPFVIFNIVMVVVSQVMTYNEYSIYSMILTIAMGWSVLLTLVAMMEIHDYSIAKTILSSLLTIVGIAIILFIFLLFFSLISDGIAYFVSLYKEIVFRLY